jgi:prevent-host-death family protein
MQQIGIRELRANLGSIVRRVRAGETVELTEHGHPVARLVPLRHHSRLQQMVAEGRLVPPQGSLAELLDRERRPLDAGERPLSAILAELRADER